MRERRPFDERWTWKQGAAVAPSVATQHKCRRIMRRLTDGFPDEKHPPSATNRKYLCSRRLTTRRRHLARVRRRGRASESAIPGAYLALVVARNERRMDLGISEEALPGNHSVTPNGSSNDLRVQDGTSIISVGLNRAQRRLHFREDRKQLQQQGSPSDDISSETRPNTRIRVSTTTVVQSQVKSLS